MSKLKLLVAAGGTGGHLFPAMAVIEYLKDFVDDFSVEFVGRKDKIEGTVIPQEGYPFHPIDIYGLAKKLSFDTLVLPFKIMKSVKKVKNILTKGEFDAVLCTGAYISYPAGMAAGSLKLPLILMESNVNPGKTNRILSSRASMIITAFDESSLYFPEHIRNKIKPLGNPVRKSIQDMPDKKEAMKKFDLESGKKTLLVFGGSLGARSINNAVELNIKRITDLGLQVIWQYGKSYSPPENLPKEVHTLEFIDDMASAYAACDLVMSRSGATTVAELTLTGKPSILMPFPSASNQEQKLNAITLEKNGAAKMISDDMSHEFIFNIIENTLSNEEELKEMAENALKLAKPNAAVDAANEIIKHIE